MCFVFKHLRLYEANGEVTSYIIEWKPLHSNQKPQSVQRPGEFNKTQIDLPAGDNGDYQINVTAINSAGSSPPSSVTTVQLPSGKFIHSAKISAKKRAQLFQ